MPDAARLRVVVVATAAASLLGACVWGAGAPAFSTLPPSPSSGVTPAPSRGESVPPAVVPPRPAKPQSTTAAIDVQGVVRAGVESGCLVLEAHGAETTFTLVGETSGLVMGELVTVRGTLRPDIMTTCQQGQVLDVRSSGASTAR